MSRERDLTWFKDDKWLIELKKSCNFAKWKTDVEELENRFKTFERDCLNRSIQQETDWTYDNKFVLSGKFYKDFSREKQKFIDSVT